MTQIMPIPLAFISDSNFAMQTSVAITSLMENKAAHTQYQIYVIAAGCQAKDLGPLAAMPCVHIIETSLDAYADIKQMAHIPIACLLKFAVCDLIPQHDKILYLDGDIIVREDVSPLYSTNLEENYAAAVFSRLDPGDPTKKINAGIMLFNAQKMRAENMGQELMAYRRTLGDKASMDQQSFNSLLGKNILPLPARYNCTPASFEEDIKRYGMQRLNKLLDTNYADLDTLVADGCIIHYSTGSKPWKYVHTPHGDEWFAYYKKSPYKDLPLHRQNRWQQRYEIFWDEYKQGGVKAVIKRIVFFFRHKIAGKKPDIHWG